jgi:hypothetical protein
MMDTHDVFYNVNYINKVKQIRKRMNFISHNYIYAIILFKFLWYRKKKKKTLH